MSKDNETSVAGLLFLLFVICPLTIMLNGYAISVLWGWFIVTTFGLVALSVPQAIGMSLMVSYLTHHSLQKDEHSTGEKIAIAILKPILALGFGWIITLFM
jgi:hypothetical protein